MCFSAVRFLILYKLRAVSALEVDTKVRNCAHVLNDVKLLAKLSAGDLIAVEAK